MSARLVLPGTATEADWLEARRQGITASEIAVVMGLSPYSSPYALYWRKRGELPDEEDKAVFERGHVLEPYIAAKFAERRPEFAFGVEGDGRTLFAHRDRPWQLATPDRVLMGEGPVIADYLCCELHKSGFAPAGGMAPCCDTNDCGPCCEACPTCPTANGANPVAVLECKTDAGEDDWGDEGTDEIPVHYRCQVLWQMDVMGVSTGYVACLLMRQWKIRVYELTLDGAAQIDLKIMRDTAQCFLDDIRDGNAPEVDWRPATGQALRRLHPSVVDKDIPIGPALRIQYQAAVRRYDAAKQRKALLTNRMLDAIGDGRRAVAAGPGAEVIATRSASEPKRVNATQLRAEYPAAAAACTHGPEHPEIKLTPAKPKDGPRG